MKKAVQLLLTLVASFAPAQEKDSLNLISEVIIDAYQKPVSFLRSARSVAVAGQKVLQNSTDESLLQSLNLLPGTRMEERSPGSYRLSVRGSTLRSPFGIRNIKIYLDDFILTDATGNSYLNLLDPALFSAVEIYKGPEPGDFGAATGGTALLKTSNVSGLNGRVNAGTYDQFSQNLAYSDKTSKNYFKIFESSFTSQSYREQAALQRKNIFLKDHWNYNDGKELRAMLLLSDLHYETPGGLTLQQMEENRRQARPATSVLPGAAAQKAGIFNKTVLGGISHRLKISPQLSHFVMLQHNYTDLRNPFITNFEKRFENNSAIRTHLSFEENLGKVTSETRAGLEAATNSVMVKNFENQGGTAGEPQRFDELKTNAAFYFLSHNFKAQKWNLEAAISLNSTMYQWRTLFPEQQKGDIKFSNYGLLSFGFTYLLSEKFSLRAKVAKGNSPPTSEEIRSSTQQINQNLYPEFGWNREIGLRKQFGNVFFVEASYFDFELKDAIVRLQNDAGQEYFSNAGSTSQRGIEFLAETRNFRLNGPLSGIQGWFSGSLFNFKYSDYRKDNSDFSGNQIPAVPARTLQAAVKAEFYKRLHLRWTSYYTSKIYLDDANSVHSAPSFVNNIAIAFPVRSRKAGWNFDLQIQNIFNENYVSGYDINAFGKRFYNPAATRTFNLGLTYTSR